MIQPGDRFGLLTVVRELNKRTNKGERQYECACDCGRMTTLRKSALTGNRPTRSCGCLRANGGKKSAAIKKDSMDYEAAFIERLEDRYDGRFEYVSGYVSGDKHCDITYRCAKCGCSFIRSKKRSSVIECPECRRSAKFECVFNDRYGHAFEYLGGYEGIGSTITIRCMECGAVRTRKVTRKLFAKDANVCCRECWNNRRGYEPSICESCGDEFMRFSEYQVMCASCHKAAQTRKHTQRKKIDHRIRDARAKSNGEVDYTVTLSKLIERDNGVCQLCNREVDESDYTYVGDAFVAGNDYPSIDHIVPLSKGGVHQWSNVQLAHRICNSIKSNK